MDIKGKKIVIFNTCSITGIASLELMKKTVEEAGAIIVDLARFKGFFKPKLKQVFKFSQSVNNALTNPN
ncbi:MAG: hypothetical protein HGN29_08440 [Asgard group archaeon]|nr:hypothetical protein [Asgard group archaeon]